MSCSVVTRLVQPPASLLTSGLGFERSTRSVLLALGLVLVSACQNETAVPGGQVASSGSSHEASAPGGPDGAPDSNDGAASGPSSGTSSRSSAAGSQSAPLLNSEIQRSVKNDLIWKRYRAVKSDLMRALSLTADEVCRELGLFDCVDEVHLAALGGNEPFKKMLYRPSDSPTATTSVAVDRVVWSACAARVAKDAAGPRKVFQTLDLDVATLDPVDVATQMSADLTTTTLYRALLARDPQPAEKELVRQLLVDDEGRGVSARDFALCACFAIGSSAEFLFL